MFAIGITGGISTGKTTFCDCLAEILPTARFFNADLAARELVDSNQEVKHAIIAEFGPGIYSATGHLNRAQLRAIVFQNAVKKALLEQILHPRIRRQWSAEAETHRQSSDFFFADIPLLYETGGETLCDFVVLVACSPDLQRERLMSRSRRLSSAQAEEMIKSQMPLSEKMTRARHVVWNNDGRALLAAQARDLVGLWQEAR
jgi:dephospho-CoA kinase